MNKLTEFCRSILALALVFSLTLGLCANGLTAFAAKSESSTTQKDAILDLFFNNGETTKDSFAKLLSDSGTMENYVNESFYYVPNKSSTYVAIGDDSAMGANKKGTTYVDLLAKKLNISSTKVGNAQQKIQDVFSVITDNSALIKSADFITVGWSNFGATYSMFKSMRNTPVVRVSDDEWKALVGEDLFPEVENLLAEMFLKLEDIDTSSFGSYDLKAGLEWYAYTYMSNTILQCQVIEAIRGLNKNAVIVLVGTYNDMENVKVSSGGGFMDLGDLMQGFINSYNYLSTKNAEHYNRVVYVDASDVDTDLDGLDTSKLTAAQLLMQIVGYKSLPNSTGHAYICDQIYTAISNTCAHTWDDGVVTREPTCKNKGVKTVTCTWCGETKTESVPATGNHIEKTRIENQKEPTCVTDGSYNLVTYCEECKTIIKTEKKTVPATGKHEYTSEITKAPGCETTGLLVHTCKVCQDSYTEELPATGHSFGKWEQTKAPTCVEAGEERRDCANCDHFETRPVSTTEHTYKAVVTAPTCTEEGYTTYTCSVCGDSYVDDKVAATGHSFGQWKQTKAPSCTEEGEERRDCANCDHYETRTVAIADHDYEAVVTAPTCTEGGYTTYTCRVCGETYVDDRVEALGHDWNTTVQDETCCEDGLTTDTCVVCGETKSEIIPANGEHDLVYVDNENGISHSVSCRNSGKELNNNELHEFIDGICAQCGAEEICQHQWDEGVVSKAPTCCATGEIVFTCVKCEETHTEELPVDADAHTGNNHIENSKDPSCTESGYTGDVVCECGVKIASGEEIAPLGHSFGQWEQIKAPSCTEEGEERRECENCDHFETRPVAITEHAYEAVVTAPTCTEDGYTTYTCTECGASYVGDKVEALGHSFGQWEQTKAPSCTEEGEERRECEICDHFETRPVAITEHTYEAVVTAPTCTEDGYTTYTCVCGRSYVGDQVEPLGHAWETTTLAETCCEDGVVTHTCTSCGEIKIEAIPASGEHDLIYTDNENGVGHSVACRNSGKVVDANELHNFVEGVCPDCGAEEICQHQWNDGVVTQSATCCTTGEMVYTCALCAETYVEILPVDAAAHTGNNHIANVKNATCTQKGYSGDTVCECGAVLIRGEEIAMLDHSFGNWIQTKVPTCTEEGAERRECANCHHYETRTVAMVEHTYKAVVTAPTCTAEGYTTYTCTQCGDRYVDDLVEALGHSFGEWFQTKAPSCGAAGQERRECANCDAYEVREIAATEHTYKAVVTAPTCTAEGYTTYTCTQCGDRYVDDLVEALGHSFGEWFQTKAPSCTQEGEERRECANCDAKETRGIATIEHSYKSVVTAPTCTEDGYTTHTCVNCGASYVTDSAAATGHVWDNGVVTKEPTATTDGVMTYTCTVCGATKTEVIEKTGGSQDDVIYDIPEDNTVVIPENDCFEAGTTVKVEQLEQGDIFDQVQEVMQNRAESYVAYEFTATMDGVTVQPNGKLTVTFTIPAGYSDNVAVYYMAKNGTLTKLTAAVDAENRTVTVELEHFSTYIVADEDTAPEVDVLMGDVNNDGNINSRDARLLLRYLAGLVTEDDLNLDAANFNGDRYVNVRDARAILNYIAGIG